MKGQELKADLSKIDKYFDALPEDVKEKGTFSFASDPPLDTSFLVTCLWDKHHPKWRQQIAEHKKLSPEEQKALVDLISSIPKEGQPITSNTSVNIQDAY